MNKIFGSVLLLPVVMLVLGSTFAHADDMDPSEARDDADELMRDMNDNTNPNAGSYVCDGNGGIATLQVANDGSSSINGTPLTHSGHQYGNKAVSLQFSFRDGTTVAVVNLGTIPNQIRSNCQ